MSSLLVNGNLEAWTGSTPDSWTKTVAGSSTVTQDVTDPHAGTSCALISINAGSNGQIVQTVTGVGGASYTFSVWYKNTAAATLSARVIITTGADSGKWLRTDGSWGAAQNLPLVTNASWTQYSLAAAAFPSNGNVSVTLRDLDGGTYTVRVDDVFFGTASTLYTQGVSGALSFAGSSVKAPSRRLTGAVSFSGATARAFSTPRMLAPASLRFVGGAALFPGLPLYPSPDTWPNPGEIFMTLNRQLNAAFQPHGVLSSGVALVRTVTAVLQPTGVLVKQTSRRLTAALQPVISAFTKTASTHAFTKLLTASLRASGQLTTARVLPPADGGGGYATPMSDDFFRRYKPTLRRQKQRI